jgi:hypothetical protein
MKWPHRDTDRLGGVTMASALVAWLQKQTLSPRPYGNAHHTHLNCAKIVAQVIAGDAPIVVRYGIARIQVYSSGVVGDGRVVKPQLWKSVDELHRVSSNHAVRCGASRCTAFHMNAAHS